MHSYSPYRRRRARVCAAMQELTRHQPGHLAEFGPPLRRFESGALTLVARDRGGWTVLEAWLHGEGKVASFRTLPEADYYETLSWRPAVLERWEAVLDFELGARTETADGVTGPAA